MPKTTTVIYTLRGEDDPAGFEQLRLTVGQLSAYTVGKWHALRQQVQDFMSERIGQYPTAMEPEDWEQYPPEEFGLYEAATRWTRAVAATVKVERRTDPEGEFEDAELPKEWQTIKGALDPETGISLTGLYFWENAAIEVNPGFWLPYLGGTEKKAGLVKLN